MTINEMIECLIQTRGKHGDVRVYFDCPKCKDSFTPDTLVAAAVHLTATKYREKLLT